MRWTYSIKNKSLASVVLLSLCLLVLFSNYIDRNHTENVKKSISTLYADRLIAEDYILKMTSCLYQIKEVINTDTGNINKNSRIKNLLLTIKETSNSYHKTKFTELERIKANELLNTLQEIEPTQSKNTQLKLESANKALTILNELSVIQLAESKQIMNYAERLYLSGKTSSQFVFALIIIILIVLQLLVFTSKTLIQKEKTDFPHLN